MVPKLFSPISKSLINSAHLNSKPRSIHSYIFFILRGSHLPLLIVSYHLTVLQWILWLCPLPYSYLFSLKDSNGGSLWKPHWKLRKIKCLRSFILLFQQLFPEELRKPIFFLFLLVRSVWRSLRLCGAPRILSWARVAGAVRGAERPSPGGTAGSRSRVASCAPARPFSILPAQKGQPGLAESWASSRVRLEVQQMCPSAAIQLQIRGGWNERC